MSSSNRGVAKAAGIVMTAIFVSRILGFVRERAVAEVFGRTWVTDVFFAAFSIPDLMYQLLVGGALSSAFIPVFTGYLAEGKEDEAWHVASTFINFIVLALLALMTLGLIFTPFLAPLVGMGFAGEQRELLVLLMRITFPAVFFTALSGLCMGVLNSYQSFTLPAIGPIFYNLSQILGAYLLGPLFGIFGMAIGTIAGALGNFGIQFPGVFVRSKGAYRPILDLTHPGIRTMFRLMVPAMVGLSIAQVNLIVGQNLASLLEPGSIVALRLANRLIHFPLGVFAMGISTAIFPTLTRLAARTEMEEFRRTFSFGLRTVMYVTIPSAVGMAVLSVPIVRLLFESGQFAAADTHATAYAVVFYSLGLFSQSCLQILIKIFYSLHDTITPVKVGLLTVIVNLVFSLGFLLLTDLGHGGIALAFSLTTTINVFVYLGTLRRKLGTVDGRRLAIVALKALTAAALMGAAVFGAADVLQSHVDLATVRGRSVQTFSAIAVGIAVYIPASFVLRMEEPLFVWDMIKTKFGRSKE